MKVCKSDVLMIGSGIAGLMTAELLYSHKHVRIFTKSSWSDSNSMKAQGGVAAAMIPGDHWTHHFFDTLSAGDFHNIEESTEILVKNGSNSVKKMIDFGVPFDRDRIGNIMLGQEGAHKQRRILHAGGDATGKALVSTLIDRVKENITLHENESVFELAIQDGQCVGVFTKNQHDEIIFYQAEHVVLATGGAGALYEVTSNDLNITGDGFAIAYRAGVELTDMEFVQFHPTMLTVGEQCGGLISEAVRGEGAKLIDEEGTLIMKGVHEQKDLAPRNIVAKTIHETIQKNKKVFLDISMIEGFEKRFPTITKNCKKLGIDPVKGLLPVAPGAHFIMGGIVADTKGRTNLPGLYAVGEASCTGVHGANRLASNSLLEAIVFAGKVAEDILLTERKVSKFIPFLSHEGKRHQYLPNKKDIQTQMTKHVGIIRDKQHLLEAKAWFEQYLDRKDHHLVDWSLEQIELLNMLTTGWLITTSALQRTESRGGHYRSDYPQKDKTNWEQRRIVRKRGEHEQDQAEKIAATIFS